MKPKNFFLLGAKTYSLSSSEYSKISKRIWMMPSLSDRKLFLHYPPITFPNFSISSILSPECASTSTSTPISSLSACSSQSTSTTTLYSNSSPFSCCPSNCPSTRTSSPTRSAPCTRSPPLHSLPASSCTGFCCRNLHH